MQLVEKHIFKYNEHMDSLCFRSKNLYNYINYVVKTIFLATSKIPQKYDIINACVKYNQPDYRSLPAQSSQQVIFQVIDAWKGYFARCKKCSGKKRSPGFKHKDKGRNIISFTNQQAKLKNGLIYFPEATNIPPIKTKVTNLQQVRIVPQNSCFVVEITYTADPKKENICPDLYMSIDLGVNNFATIVTNSENQRPLLVSGKIIKSINQYYNKKRAQIQSVLQRCKQGYISKKIRRLDNRRKNKILDACHKISRFIINYAIKNKIGNIILGYNKGWKEQIDNGPICNQIFNCMPHYTLKEQLIYKSNLHGINIIINEESYTSKCDALSLESLKNNDIYLGKRIKRGLFQSAKNKIINADVNGALNIMRKVVDDSVAKQIIDRGLVYHPIKINVLINPPLE